MRAWLNDGVVYTQGIDWVPSLTWLFEQLQGRTCDIVGFESFTTPVVFRRFTVLEWNPLTSTFDGHQYYWYP